MSVNKVILVGNLGRDPEVRTFQNGGKVVNLRVATSESWKDRNSGERRERTEWHTVAVFQEGAARFAEKYLRKGSKVYIEGKLETRKWQDQDGNDRYSTEITIRPYGGELQNLSPRDNDGGAVRAAVAVATAADRAAGIPAAEIAQAAVTVAVAVALTAILMTKFPSRQSG